MKSKYSEGFDYDHRFHAGNVGDVLKHCALLAWAKGLVGTTRWLDTHAGAGMYALPKNGEWEAGVGRLDRAGEGPSLIQEYRQAVERSRTPGRGGLYPGSPALLRALLGERQSLTLVEWAEEPRGRLASFYAADGQVEVVGGDGLAVLREQAAKPGPLAAFVDPAYTRKDEWVEVGAALVDALATNPEASCLVWYPIKSLMRPRELLATARRAGLAGAAVELVTTPLRLKKKALNGSGLLCLGKVPPAWMSSLTAILPWLGELLASHPEAPEFSFQVSRWPVGVVGGVEELVEATDEPLTVPAP